MEPLPIALIHGFATSFLRTWKDNAWVDLLTDAGREVIPVDLLGHGTADKPHDPSAYAELEDHALAQLPTSPIDAVGFSMGARTLLYLAATNPGRFQRLVVAGVGRNLFERDEDHGRSILAGVAGEAPPEDPVGRHFGDLARAPDQDVDALLALMQRPAGIGISAELLAAIEIPVLVVLGDEDFAGPADLLMDALPNAELVTLRGVDHFSTPKDFGFIDAALGFLDAQPF